MEFDTHLLVANPFGYKVLSLPAPALNIAEIVLPSVISSESFRAEGNALKSVHFKLAISLPVEGYATDGGLLCADFMRRMLGGDNAVSGGGGLGTSSTARLLAGGRANVGDVECLSVVQEVVVGMDGESPGLELKVGVFAGWCVEGVGRTN